MEESTRFLQQLEEVGHHFVSYQDNILIELAFDQTVGHYTTAFSTIEQTAESIELHLHSHQRGSSSLRLSAGESSACPARRPAHTIGPDATKPAAMLLPEPRILLSTQWRKPDQIIQPFQFGHMEQKATCLWLQHFPKLQPTTPQVTLDWLEKNVPKKERMRVWNMAPSETRARDRSVTYAGIAKAMADQWTPFLYQLERKKHDQLRGEPSPRRFAVSTGRSRESELIKGA